MNIEEAKQVLDKIQICSNEVGSVPLVETHKVKALLDQIDQPKVVTPKSVFEMIKFRKEHDHDLTTTFVNIHAYPDNVFHWVANNSDLFAQAWLAYPNITIEKEKLYKARDKRLHPDDNYLNFDKRSECWFFSTGVDTYSFAVKHTRKELEESGFNVFDDDNYEVIEVTE